MKSDIKHRQTLPSERGRSLNFSMRNSEAGFSLVETTIALLLMTIVGLGAVSLSLFSIYNNSGGSDRATALAIAQQTLERLRSAQFNQAGTDPTLTGGTYFQMTPSDGRVFKVTKIIDDNPKTSAVDVNPSTTLKLVTVTVESQSIGRGWARGQGGTITLITERTKKNY
jgi:Tfp pilus assembly protein PilV